MNIFECYGLGEGGSALVCADSRAIASTACREWLGWDVCVVFRASEKYATWQKGGGSTATPVVYAEDNEHYEVVVLRRGQ